jgi:hypothetical protein
MAGSPKGTLAKLKEVREFLLSNRQPPGAEVGVQRITKAFGALQQKLYGHLASSARTELEQAKNARNSKDYAAVVERAAEAKDLCSLAKNALDLAVKKTALDQEYLSKLLSELNEIEEISFQGRSQLALKAGRAHLHAGLEVAAKGDLRSLQQAIDEFQAADKHLAAANEFEATKCVSEREKARVQITSIRKLIEPANIDFWRREDMQDWDARDWSWTFDGTINWLRAQRIPDAVLKNADLEFPKSFLLQLDLGLIDRKNELKNEYWKFYRDLLVISLIPRDSESKELMLSIGHNPKLVLERFAHLQIDRKCFDGSQIANSKGVVALALSLQKGNLSCRVAEKESKSRQNADWTTRESRYAIRQFHAYG